MLVKGKPIADAILANVADRVKQLKEKGRAPKLAVVLVGEDKPSQTYVRKKGEAAQKVGINFELIQLPASISKQEIINKIHHVQENSQLSGLIVQLPLPEPLYTTEVLNAIRPDLDIDCLTDVNLGKLVMKTDVIAPPTPGAVMAIVESLDVDLSGKEVTIVGTGALVGKPLAIILMNKGATVTTCNSQTKNIKEKCFSADIVVSAVGKKDLIRGDMIKPGAIVIDSGVDYVNNVMFGDVNVHEVEPIASYVTPTPGGVGPITVARLLLNTVILEERSVGIKN